MDARIPYTAHLHKTCGGWYLKGMMPYSLKGGHSEKSAVWRMFAKFESFLRRFESAFFERWARFSRIVRFRFSSARKIYFTIKSRKIRSCNISALCNEIFMLAKWTNSLLFIEENASNVNLKQLMRLKVNLPNCTIYFYVYYMCRAVKKIII